MSKEKEVKEKETNEAEINLNTPVNLTAEDVIKLVALMQDKNAKTLAEALEKLSPHYVEPGQKENLENARKQQREIELFKIRRKRSQQRVCEHEIGQTGRKRLGEGAFNGLKLPTGETIGVCTYCHMVISSANPDHQKYFRKMGGTIAESGQFTLNDPIKAQLARLGEDERQRVLAAREKYLANTPKEVDLEEELI